MAKYLTYNKQDFSVGDTIRVHVKIKEGDKFRIQVFEGILIAIDNKQSNKMFCVRKIGIDGIGIERIFPVDGPMIANIELKKSGKVKRAKLHYLRNRIGKTATNIREDVDAMAEQAKVVAAAKVTAKNAAKEVVKEAPVAPAETPVEAPAAKEEPVATA